uniref:Uncharacterized protein n=1 Tax=Magnetococcus massalia (strain MO-1) TaxID=451514 RepID=A0A1S7LLQ1_MAGMO|nr:protein of unknown function [Candidatus Magnetococcus massalia]
MTTMGIKGTFEHLLSTLLEGPKLLPQSYLRRTMRDTMLAFLLSLGIVSGLMGGLVWGSIQDNTQDPMLLSTNWSHH